MFMTIVFLIGLLLAAVWLVDTIDIVSRSLKK